jgi:hypothetical protein
MKQIQWTYVALVVTSMAFIVAAPSSISAVSETVLSSPHLVRVVADQDPQSTVTPAWKGDAA